MMVMVGRRGFEPLKAVPTDLQSVPFGHFGISPDSEADSFLRRIPPGKRRLTTCVIDQASLLKQPAKNKAGQETRSVRSETPSSLLSRSIQVHKERLEEL